MNISRSLLRCVKTVSDLKYSTNIQKSCQEIIIPVPWGHIAGKWWGPTDKRPILSIHGWQDNCGTFNRLIPLLTNDVGFLTIDLPGHGLSSKLPHGMYYFSVGYITLIETLRRYLGWDKISLMGHSLGGVLSYTYGMIYPNIVDFAICLDAAKPMIRRQNNVHMAKAIDNFLRFSQYEMSNEEPPSYTIDEIKKKICAPNKDSVHYEHSHHIMERMIAPSKKNPGKFYFTRDNRLKAGGLVNFPQNEILEYTETMKFPIFIGKATKSSYYEIKENFYEVLAVLKRSSKDCSFHYIEGTHHYHLNNPESVSDLLNEFIKKHNVEDRSIGGIKKEMIVDVEDKRRAICSL